MLSFLSFGITYTFKYRFKGVTSWISTSSVWLHWSGVYEVIILSLGNNLVPKARIKKSRTNLVKFMHSYWLVIKSALIVLYQGQEISKLLFYPSIIIIIFKNLKLFVEIQKLNQEIAQSNSCFFAVYLFCFVFLYHTFLSMVIIKIEYLSNH